MLDQLNGLLQIKRILVVGRNWLRAWPVLTIWSSDRGRDFAFCLGHFPSRTRVDLAILLRLTRHDGSEKNQGQAQGQTNTERFHGSHSNCKKVSNPLDSDFVSKSKSSAQRANTKTGEDFVFHAVGGNAAT